MKHKDWSSIIIIESYFLRLSEYEKNQIIDLEITDLSYEAMGVAHYEGMTVFVTNALPGEVVSAKILKVKKNFALAKIEEIKKKVLIELRSS